MERKLRDALIKPLTIPFSVIQPCPTLWDSRDCSSPGSSVHEISQARILDWVAISSSRGPSPSRIKHQIKKVFPSGGKGQKALHRDVIQKMILAQTDDASIRTAIDAFIVSFALMGANLADLYLATPFQGDEWIYNRVKTTERRADGAELRVKIPSQIKPFLQRLQEGDGGWWLPRLHEVGAKKHTCNEKINDYLRRWQTATEVEDFTFYAARHSWATIARALGVDLASVNDCLCHKDSLEMGRRYAPLTWEQKNEINQKVIESFEWM